MKITGYIIIAVCALVFIINALALHKYPVAIVIIGGVIGGILIMKGSKSSGQK